MGPKKRLAGAEPPAKRRRTSEVSAANQSSSSSTDETMIVVFIQNITSNILAEPQKVGVLTRAYLTASSVSGADKHTWSPIIL